MKSHRNTSAGLIACITAFAISTPLLQAQLNLTFDGAGDNTVIGGTITVDLDTNTASIATTTGTGTIGNPTISGALGGLTGSFDIHFEARGTTADTFDPADFTGGLADGIFTTATEWGPISDINILENTFVGQGIVFTFDFSNVVGGTGSIDLTGVRWQNTNDGSRLRFRDEGAGGSTPVYDGGATLGSDVTAALGQSLDTDDEVAFFAGTATGPNPGNGQVRLKEFSFSLPAELYAHLDATDAGSVSFVTGNEVAAWADQTANGFDATATTAGGGVGNLLYPSTSLSPTGLAGLDAGTVKNQLLWFTPGQQDNWLDFTPGTGAAESSLGFAFFAVVKADDLRGGNIRDLVVANRGDIGGGFVLRLQGGIPQFVLGSSGLITQGASVLSDGDTVLLGVNYDATTGSVEFWDSGNGSSATTTVAPADFSQTTDIFLAGSPNVEQFLDGMLGEMKLYRGPMSSARFSQELGLLKDKWIGLSPPVLEVDAGLDTDADNIWEDTTGYGYDFYLDTTNGVARVAVTGSATTLTHAYDFPGGFDQFGLAPEDGGQEGTVGGAKLIATSEATGADFLTECRTFKDGINASPPIDDGTTKVSLEFWIKPEDIDPAAANGQIIWEDGGATGWGLFINNNQIYSDNDAGNDNRISYNLGTDPLNLLLGDTATSDYLHVVMTRDPSTGKQQLFLNGQLVGTATDNTGLWSGGDGVGLGGRGESNVGGVGNGDVGIESFDGQIARFRIYPEIMSPALVQANFDAMISTPSGTDFTTWITGDFANGTVTLQGPDDDNDGDGISNLIEFAIDGEDPTVPNASVGSFTGLELSFTKRADTTGLTYAIEQSTDLGGSDPWEEVAGGSYVNDDTTISYTLPGTNPKDFLRLKVNQ